MNWKKIHWIKQFFAHRVCYQSDLHRDQLIISIAKKWTLGNFSNGENTPSRCQRCVHNERYCFSLTINEEDTWLYLHNKCLGFFLIQALERNEVPLFTMVNAICNNNGNRFKLFQAHTKIGSGCKWFVCFAKWKWASAWREYSSEEVTW